MKAILIARVSTEEPVFALLELRRAGKKKQAIHYLLKEHGLKNKILVSSRNAYKHSLFQLSIRG